MSGLDRIIAVLAALLLPACAHPLIDVQSVCLFSRCAIAPGASAAASSGMHAPRVDEDDLGV